jgi:hypothetical protein
VTAFDYTRPQATALRLIQRFGQAAVLSRMTTSTYNPTTSKAVPSGVQENVQVVMLPYSTFLTNVPGSTITQEDQKVYMAYGGNAGDPNPDDMLNIGGQTYTIMSVSRLAPAGVVVFYELQVRR